MAGNKALEKFKDSKVPKKGSGTTNTDLPIYQEPNTHSKVIGTIKKDENFDWVGKSICEGKEFVRCDKNFGYIAINEINGKCNLNMDTVKEIKFEKLEIDSNKIIYENELTEEEKKLGDQAQKEILEKDDEKDCNNNYSNNTSSSTNQENDSCHNDIFNKTEEQLNNIFDIKNDEVFKENDTFVKDKYEDIFKEDNLINVYFGGDISNLDEAINYTNKENQKLKDDILSMMKENKEQENNIIKSIKSINDIIPGQFNIPNSDLLLKTLELNPGGKKYNNELINENKEEDEYITIENINTVVDGIADGMKESKASFRLTDGKKGNKISFKYYKSGWNGGSKAGIKTYNISKIGEKIGKLTGVLGDFFTIKNIYDGYKEDGNKIGDNTKIALSEEISSSIGEAVCAGIGTLLFGPIGTVIGAIFGSFYFGKKGKEYCEKRIEEQKQKKEEEKN